MSDKIMPSIIEAIESLQELEVVKNDSVNQHLLTDLHQKISQDYYTVVVLGEFKRGKSSFINALLKKEILPTDVLPETATINMIIYDDKPRLQVIYKNGHKEEGEVSLAYLRQFSAGNSSKKLETVDYIKIGYPLEMLKERIVLVDTPGVADLDDMRTDVTYEFLPQANAVIFLLDANTPLTQTEKEFIEERLVPQGINDIMFIVNKYDCIDDEEDEDFLEELKLRLDDVFKINTNDAKLKSYTIVPLSAKMALQGIERDNINLLTASGISDVQDCLSKLLSYGNITQKKQHYAKFNLLGITNQILQNIEKQVTIAQASIDELTLIERTLLEEMSDRTKQRSSINTYVLSIQDSIFAICDKSLQTFGHKLQEDIVDQIELYQGADFKDFIEKHITKRIQKSIENWISIYTPQINTLVKMLEREISVAISQEFNKRIQLKVTTHGELKSSKKMLQLSAADISNVTFQAGAIAAAGGIGLLAIAGSSIMPLISFAALPYLRSYMLKKKLSEVKQEVLPMISSQINKIRQQLGKEVHNYVIEECQMVMKNTDCAYDILLEQMKKDISVQINDKRTLSSEKRFYITSLMKDAERVKCIAASIGG